MHIVCIHQHYSTPEGCGCVRSYEFTKKWVEAGHKVTVITGHWNRSGFKLDKGLIQRQSRDGIGIILVGAKYKNEQSFFFRILVFLHFMFFSTYILLRTKKVDVVYAISTPLTVGIPAVINKFFKRTPFVFEVEDQWPEIPIEMGILKSRMLGKILLWLEKYLYKHADSLVALSPGMADGMRKVMKVQKPIAVIPNGCVSGMFEENVDGSVIREKYGWGDKLVFLHAGSMGIVNSLNFILDAGLKLQDHPEILFVLFGEGSQKPALEQRLKELGLTNVEIRPSIPQNELPSLYAAVDVGMVIIGQFPIIEHNSASKFFDTLISGTPVLLNYSGWQREVIESGHAGYGTTLYDLDEFVDRVLYINSHREELLELARNARQIGLDKFDREKLAKQALDEIVALKP